MLDSLTGAVNARLAEVFGLCASWMSVRSRVEVCCSQSLVSSSAMSLIG